MTESQALLAADADIQSRAVGPARTAPDWQPIVTAPKDVLVDIWIGGGVDKRWADCYYDHICNEWRTSRPSGILATIPARLVTHWMSPPGPPPY